MVAGACLVESVDQPNDPSRKFEQSILEIIFNRGGLFLRRSTFDVRRSTFSRPQGRIFSTGGIFHPSALLLLKYAASASAYGWSVTKGTRSMRCRRQPRVRSVR